MATAPKGAAPEAIKGRLGNAKDTLPSEASQQKTHAARQRLNWLTAKLDALAVWKADLQHRIAIAEAKLHTDGNLYFSRLYSDEMDDLIDAVAAWRLAAARVVLDLDAKGLGDGAERRES